MLRLGRARRRTACALKSELGNALTRIKADASVRAVVVTGAGDQAFSAGQDLTEAKDMTGREAEEWVREYELLYDHVRMLDVPVIAAVNGWAMGAGCQLALLADIRISSENARSSAEIPSSAPGARRGTDDQGGPTARATLRGDGPGANAGRLCADRDEAEQAVRAPEDR